MTNDVVITGIGLVSSLGEGIEAHARLLRSSLSPVFNSKQADPFPIHSLPAIDYDRFIPKKSDQKQMGLGQRLGVVAAGLALEDAGILNKTELLEKTHLYVAAGGGQRDIELDESIMGNMRTCEDFGSYLNKRLSSDLRPTLFLTQLPNLFAGNISITLGVTGSSRTFMGEESAGLEAISKMAARIRAGAVEIGLAGGAFATPDRALQCIYGFDGSLLKGLPINVWARNTKNPGMILSAIGAFLLLESRAHAEARGAAISAVLGPIGSGYCVREGRDIFQSAQAVWDEVKPSVNSGALGVLSGATGAEPATSHELAFLTKIGEEKKIYIRGTGSMIGHSLEAAMPANVALAALALREAQFFPPFDNTDVEQNTDEPISQILVTNFGHWRGEGMALLTRHQVVPE